jgi:hypothetical protein
MKYMNISCIYAYFNFSFEGQNRTSEPPKRIESLYFDQIKSAEVFDNMRNSNLPINLAFRTRSSYRLDFDDLYGIIQPQVKANFITNLEKQHIINSIFIMIQNGISLASKAVNLIKQSTSDNTTGTNASNPFSGFM